MTAGVGERATDAASGATSTLGDGERQLTDLLDRWFDGRWRVAEVVLYVLAAIAAWVVRFVQDDAAVQLLAQVA